MPNYVIFNSEGTCVNVIVCEEWDTPPDGHTKQLVPENYYWDWDAQQMVRSPLPRPIQIESL